MKTEFNKNWNSSKQTRKQRKYRHNAPTHVRRKLIGAVLSKELREKYGTRNTHLRSGDEVKVMRGKFFGKQGKVGEIDLKHLRIKVDGISREKRTGEKIETWFDSSKVKIISLNTSDSKRFKKVIVKTEKDSIKETKPEVKENKTQAKETKQEIKKENAPKKK